MKKPQELPTLSLTTDCKLLERWRHFSEPFCLQINFKYFKDRMVKSDVATRELAKQTIKMYRQFECTLNFQHIIIFYTSILSYGKPLTLTCITASDRSCSRCRYPNCKEIHHNIPLKRCYYEQSWRRTDPDLHTQTLCNFNF